jgi:hypothetical protein
MKYEKAVEMVLGALGAQGVELVGLLAPSTRLIVEEEAWEGDGERPGSYLGGKPMLGEGAEWPRWDPAGHMQRRIVAMEAQLKKRPGDVGMRDYLEGLKRGLGSVPLGFLGQIDLGEIFAQAPVAGWPESGTLSLGVSSKCLMKTKEEPAM